jgi:elongation factor P--(R)-beta-lysine ligase
MTFSVECARARAGMMAMIRQFFADRGVLEVETPLLGAAASTDCHIDLFSAAFIPSGAGPAATGETCYLQTSPELFMKRLLAEGFPDIFQIGKVFRNGECGRHHNPEFTMLEWYRRGVDLYGMIDETAGLLQELCEIATVNRITYRDLLLQSTGIDPLAVTVPELESFTEQQSGQKLSFATVTDGLQYLMAAVIEPGFDPNSLTVVYLYPREQAVLSTVDREDRRVARRFEIYGGGMELANGFEELADAAENRRRMEAENACRQQCGKPVVPVDERFITAMEKGLPPCSGVAVGCDRVLMCRTGLPSIDAVVSFGWNER